MLRFRNTLSGKIEEFHPMREGEARFYYCGPTVWEFGHIGNFRSNVAADILRRYLTFKGFKVTHVMNITDVEDRIIAKSQEAGLSIDDYTAKYIAALWEDADALGCERPDIVPRATRHIPEMVELIETLLAKQHAYKSDGSIYYRISSFPEYGKLSKINFAGNIIGGSERIDTDKYDKEDARDFALWKEPGNPTEPAWDTSIGRGRPGWHIECSAMSMKYLGPHFDIHTGAVDNIFPHHENEIAQSEAATGERFVNLWVHSEHLIVDGEKMSKSKGNFYTLADLLGRRSDPAAVRYLFLSVPYRKRLNFTWEGLDGAAAAVERIRSAAVRLREAAASAGARPGAFDAAARSAQFGSDFGRALEDDLNTPEALGAVFPFLREVNSALDAGGLDSAGASAALAAIERADKVLGILPAREETLPSEIEAQIDARNEARKRRDFAEADRIRDALAARGIVLEDGPKGTRWKKA